jgi:hypothetical protein
MRHNIISYNTFPSTLQMIISCIVDGNILYEINNSILSSITCLRPFCLHVRYCNISFVCSNIVTTPRDTIRGTTDHHRTHAATHNTIGGTTHQHRSHAATHNTVGGTAHHHRTHAATHNTVGGTTQDRKSTRLNSSHSIASRMPSSA